MTLFDQPIKERNAVVQGLLNYMTLGIGEGWTDVLRGVDDILYSICDQLIKNASNTTICPGSKDVFNAFRECKYSITNVVILGQDPYHQVVDDRRIASGIAMDCSITGILQPSLKLVYDEIERIVGYTERNPNLRPWAHQGILLINTALTVLRGKPDSHTGLWEPFTRYLVSELSRRSPSTIWVLLGAKARQHKGLIKGTVFEASHPASAAYTGGQWNSGNLFNKVNEALKMKGKQEIKW